MSANDIPKQLRHTPIYSVDYKSIDESGDAEFLSIGRAQWEDRKDISVKVFRKTKSGRWSPQSEELPFWRVFDLAIMISSLIVNGDGGDGENCQHPKCVSFEDNKRACLEYVKNDKLHKKMIELRDLLNLITL